MYDLHCHYLPAVDDGAANLQEGLLLAAAAAADGIRGAVLTPHVHPGRYDNTASRLHPHFVAFSRAVAEAGIAIELRLGCEMRLSSESIELILQGEVPSLGHWEERAVVLLELPHDTVPVGAVQAAEYLVSMGWTPMIAHPERNKTLMRDPMRLGEFVQAGCLAQLTAASVCGMFGPGAQRAAFAMLEQGWITVVASDAHNLEHRPPVMTQARASLEQRYGADIAQALVNDNPEAIFRG
ncbi:MAG: CpsB/CapC family capsule biosynthesis tyrosine phosphatase [Burkholderiaceae bacterium]